MKLPRGFFFFSVGRKEGGERCFCADRRHVGRTICRWSRGSPLRGPENLESGVSCRAAVTPPRPTQRGSRLSLFQPWPGGGPIALSARHSQCGEIRIRNFNLTGPGCRDCSLSVDSNGYSPLHRDDTLLMVLIRLELVKQWKCGPLQRSNSLLLRHVRRG